MTKTLAVIIILLAATMPAAADDFVYQGSFLWNDIRATVQSGDYLYCAFNDGIGAINLTLDFNKKKLYSTLELTGKPLRLHLFDTLLVAENENGTIDLISVADPRVLRVLGSFTPDHEFLDLECIGDFLYAAVEYDGLVRYDISRPDEVVWNDSSMAGIRVIALDARQTRLYALDDYNGVLIYEPDAAGIGEPQGELLLPYQGISLTVAGDTIYTGMRPTGYMLGWLDAGQPVYLGRRESFIRADQIFAVENRLVLTNAVNGFELQSRFGADSLDQLFPLTALAGAGDVFSFQGRPYIVFPKPDVGFIGYDIGDPENIQLEYPAMVYAYPGPITQVQFFKSRLHVVGTNNWYEIYSLSDPSRPVRSGRMINPPYHPAGFCTKGDTLFVTDVSTNTYFPFVDSGTGDPYSIFPLFSVADSIARPQIIPNYFSDGDLLYFYNDHAFNGTARNDSMVFPNRFRWSFADGLSAALIVGSVFYECTDKGILRIFTIGSNHALTDVGYIGLPGRVNRMLVVDTMLYMAGGGLVTASVADPRNPVVLHNTSDAGLIYDAQIVGSWLVCAARFGIYIFDISTGLPRLLFSGGEKATTVTLDGDRIVASDGYSVRVYTLPAVGVDDAAPYADLTALPTLSGHPNPFNSSLTLTLRGFSGQHYPVALEVFDILGRCIRRLSPLNGADGAMIWDGRDDDGRSAASGVYFFRARAGTAQAVYKAVLLK